MPYLRAIELALQDRFPGRKVKVWVEESIMSRLLFGPDCFAIVARVDDYSAYICFDPFNNKLSEEAIAEMLTIKIQELI